jgi:hypothetical protein
LEYIYRVRCFASAPKRAASHRRKIMVAIPKPQDVAALTAEALIGDWMRLTTIDKALGTPRDDKEAETVEAILERIEDVETALLARPSESRDGVRVRLRILARAIETGADAAHVVSLFDRCRGDFLDHGSISLT